jgi:hypothetical protein
MSGRVVAYRDTGADDDMEFKRIHCTSAAEA